MVIVIGTPNLLTKPVMKACVIVFKNMSVKGIISSQQVNLSGSNILNKVEVNLWYRYE